MLLNFFPKIPPDLLYELTSFLILNICDSRASRSSHQMCSIKKGVLKSLAKFTGKNLCQSLFFNKVAGLKLATLLKKRLCYSYLLVNFAKFLRIHFLQNTSGRLLLNVLFTCNLPCAFTWYDNFTNLEILCPILFRKNKFLVTIF